MADQPSNDPVLHSDEEIRGFVQRNYTGLGKAENMSIGWMGSYYRVAVVDPFKVIHTLNIEPQWIDTDRAKMEALKADGNKAVQRMAALPKNDPPKQKPKQRH